MTRPQPADVVRARVIASLRVALPALDAAAAEQALIAVNAHRHVGLHRLDDYLQDHPAALTAGGPDVPPSLHRLLRHLRAAGHLVTVPACARCGKHRPLPERRSEGRVCSLCADASRARQCARCGRVRTVAAMQSDGPLCESCYAADPARWESCSICDRPSRVAHRRPDGSPVCGSCGASRRKPETCSDCGRTAPAVRRLPTGPLCEKCYREHRVPRPCGRCGRTTVIHVRARAGAPDLCKACAKDPLAVCEGCGRLRQCTGIRAGRPRCSTCKSVPLVTCARCGQKGRCRARWPLGPVCPTCYAYVRSHPRPCVGCGRTRPLIGPAPDGAGTCGECCGAATAYLCTTCGSGRETDRGQRCARCVLRSRLPGEFPDNQGRTPAELQPLIKALLQVPKARSILVWLDKPKGGAACLRRITAAGIPLSHEALDAQGVGQGAINLRAVLVHLGVLPPRHELLARLQPWLEHLLATYPPPHRHTLRVYAEWTVLRQARRRAAHRRFTSASAARVRVFIRGAAAFLQWIDDQSLTLADLTQTDVDRWVEGHSGRDPVRSFLRWAHHRRLAAAHNIPERPRDEPHIWWDETDHWAHLRRCLKDDGLPVDVRAAGAVMLLYGTPVSRIVTLTREALTGGSQPTLILGDHPAALPPAVYSLLKQQADHTRWHSAVSRRDSPTE